VDEWNGGSYDAAVNFFFIPSTQECAILEDRLSCDGAVRFPDSRTLRDRSQSGGPQTGVLTAVDVGTGKPAWVKPLPYSAQGGVLVTRKRPDLLRVTRAVACTRSNQRPARVVA